MAKKISPVIFGLAFFLFFMPFVNVSCEGKKVASLTGIQLITGTTVKEPGMFGEKQTRKLKGEPLAALAFLSIIAGLGLSFLKNTKGVLLPAISGGVSALLLLLLKAKLDYNALNEGEGVLELDYLFSFWTTFLLSIFACGWNAFFVIQSKKEKGYSP